MSKLGEALFRPQSWFPGFPKGAERGLVGDAGDRLRGPLASRSLADQELEPIRWPRGLEGDGDLSSSPITRVSFLPNRTNESEKRRPDPARSAETCTAESNQSWPWEADW